MSRIAHRFIVYIRALGAEPVKPKSPKYANYAAALQRQYEALKRQTDPNTAKQAIKAARMNIRKVGLRAAVAHFPRLTRAPYSMPHDSYTRALSKLEASALAAGADFHLCRICRMRCGLPKRSWHSRAMAESAAKGAGGRVNVYRCPHERAFWHVGHKAVRLTKPEQV